MNLFEGVTCVKCGKTEQQLEKLGITMNIALSTCHKCIGKSKPKSPDELREIDRLKNALAASQAHVRCLQTADTESKSDLLGQIDTLKSELEDARKRINHIVEEARAAVDHELRCITERLD